MKLKIFSIRDDKVGAFMAPFALRSTGEGERAFTDLVNDPKSNVHRYPDDFALFELGEFDDTTGEYKSHEQPRSLGIGSVFKTAAMEAAKSFV